MSPENPDELDALTLSNLDELGGAPLLQEVFSLVLVHSPERVAAARAGYAGGDFAAIRLAAHSLRSSAGNVGALRLAATARHLEELAAAAVPGAALLPALEALEVEWARVKGWLEARLETLP